MRILVVGAGAVGGYFGGRLLESGCNVTFLVRPARAELLAQNGLRIVSPHGDFTVSQPPTVVASDLREIFNVILVACKAYDLEEVVDTLAPAIGFRTVVLPLLNGMRHLDLLDARFGRHRVLGGQCRIVSTLNERHEIVHMNEIHAVSFGERDGVLSERIQELVETMALAKFQSSATTEILQDMWEKWIFLSTLAGSTCLMRAAVGDILHAPGGQDLILGLLAECRSVASALGFFPREPFLKMCREVLTQPGSSVTASMMRDMENGNRIEADHVIGDLIEHGKDHSLPLLRLAYTHMKSYEARRSRAAAAAVSEG